MKPERLINTSVVMLLLVIARADCHAFAQQKPNAKTQCPATKASCPTEVDAAGRVRFTAEVSGGDKNVMPTYNWTVSAGTIESGQGTSTIQVNIEGVPGDSTVTATVEVGGFDRACGYGSTAASCTTVVIKRPEARKLDEYSNLTRAEENKRLDNFAIELQMDPLAQGYIIAYGTKLRPGDSKRLAEAARAYLVTKRAIEAKRLITVGGGVREQAGIELWIVPSGAQPPKPTPAAKPAGHR